MPKKLKHLTKAAQDVLSHLRYLYEQDADYSSQSVREIVTALNGFKMTIENALKELEAHDLVECNDKGRWQAIGATIHWE